jgi:very-short-patch-repair endonuclease
MVRPTHPTNPPRDGEGDQPNAGGGGPRVLQSPIKTVKRARKLRREMSLPEVLLWQQLRQRPGGFKFRKQCPQHPFVLDFACLETRLAIEVDGEAHDRGDRPQHDEAREAGLAALGFTTLRIPARDVLGNMEEVLMGILETCRTLGPLHHPASPDGPPPRSGEDLA